MDEGRKRVIGDHGCDSGCPQADSVGEHPAISDLADAVIFAERIMRRVDGEWPSK